MSLDVYLTFPVPNSGDGREAIFIRRDGANVEITRQEWDDLHPGADPVVATVNRGDDETTQVFSTNITHNLNKMAGEAGIYEHLWRPDEIGITKAAQLIEPLRLGLERLRGDRPRFEQFNPTNGWGDYDGLVSFVDRYLSACIEYPAADVSVWR